MRLELPEGIDYTKYTSTSGMSTKHWGPGYWVFLFTSIMGTYPYKIDETSKDDIEIKDSFVNTIKSLILLLPCIFCRESLNGFMYELPIENYTGGRIEMMYWLYLIKDKVNKKLLLQEREAFEEKKKELDMIYPKDSKKYISTLNDCIENSFKTEETPPFEYILDQYESIRASCSIKAKKCVIKK
jgi:hypothetical protein